MNKIALLVAAAAALFATSVAAQQDIGKNAKVTLVFDQQLPNVPGKSLRVVLVEYGPGGGSPSHRHPSSAFIYARVLEGAIRSKVNDAPERMYQDPAAQPGRGSARIWANCCFYETAGKPHRNPIRNT
jgi:hypothetical protein